MGTIRPFIRTVQTERPATSEDLLQIISNDRTAVLLESSLPTSIPGWGVPFSTMRNSPSRWCIAASRPMATIWAQGRKVVRNFDGKTVSFSGCPLAALEQVMDGLRVPETPEVPFVGGAIGFVSYDLGAALLGQDEVDSSTVSIPSFWVGIFEVCLLLDLSSGQLFIVGVDFPDRGGRAMAQAKDWEQRLQHLTGSVVRGPSPSFSCGLPLHGDVISETPRHTYLMMVEKALAKIRAGELFQVNLSRRLTIAAPASLEAFYLSLRRVSPSPFAAFLRTDQFGVASASPERFLLMDSDRRLETRPIKGTRPRGVTPAEDVDLSSQLWRNEKDAAELAMIVDVHRGDLGSVCEYGSVRVLESRRLEKFPQVYHTVATIEGRRRSDVGLRQLLQATFPAGSVTGAPKAHALHAIRELEPVPRSVYTGSIGYFGFDGRADLNVAVRTAVLCGDRIHFHVGGGIVADSEPVTEFEETVTKAQGFLRALHCR